MVVSAGFVDQNTDLGLQSDAGAQIARAGIEGEEIPVPFAG
ncbi:hypothetical protein DB30_04727 [Enhygromyxa salina]|uniref:Uncharacterized protein n=2 Tax=Enhygromyxa salina TaxID=215803 RepID=A0A0C2D8H9_9BACT|nr:hypothetical protein DB30_04727 [Enhygromyxa salina]